MPSWLALTVLRVMRGRLCRVGTLDVAAATKLGVPPGRAFGQLKAGRSVQTADGDWVQPEQVSGKP